MDVSYHPRQESMRSVFPLWDYMSMNMFDISFTIFFVVRHENNFCRLWPEKSRFFVKIGCADNQTVTAI